MSVRSLPFMEDVQARSIPQEPLVSVANEGERGRKTGSLIIEVLRGLVASRVGFSPKDGNSDDVEYSSDSISDVVSAEERRMLGNVFRLGERSASDAMTPRADIIALPESATLDEVTVAFLDHGLTRLPIYRENLDAISGFLHAKDVLKALYLKEKISVKALKREILFVPPSMRVAALLLKMRVSRVHMAVVVDEYGATGGLVTFYDLMREVIGESPDEHDMPEDSEWSRCEDGGFNVSARLSVEELATLTGVQIGDPDEDVEYDTVGGLLISCLGRVPNAGESYVHPEGLKFMVLEADPRRVKKVKVERC